MSNVEKSLFGIMPDGTEVFRYRITDEHGQSVVLSEYACAILEIHVLDHSDVLRDVVLGYDTLDEYLADTRAFGAVIGRYANRIAGARFSLKGKEYTLAKNNGENCLHGGVQSFRKKCFNSQIRDDTVVFRYLSKDMEEGFPGNFVFEETASFRNGVLTMAYEFHCDQDTPASITNHNYFNLNGHGRGTILGHTVTIRADRYCKADSGLLALAPAVPVDKTPFDFRTEKTIWSGVAAGSDEIIQAGGGYDHCFAIRQGDGPVATATGNQSGIRLEVYSDMPSLQFYTGNNIGHAVGKLGAKYNSYDGFCFESQQFPNAVNEPRFPSAVIRANQICHTYIAYRFTR